MAECTISRCSHERRIFRKELHKWSKEILYILGLERLAEELMGARKWKILIQPFTELESKTPADWYPEDTCYFCSAKKQPPYDPASGIIPTVEGYSSLRIDTDEHSTSSDQGNLSGSFISCASALSPWRIAALSSHGVPSSPPPLDQPLDLSIGSMRNSISEAVVCSSGKIVHSSHTANFTDDGETCTSSVLKVPQIPLKPGHRRRLDANSKRSYTEEELQAALRDIQSGKLGTRRAAVIYGIPRSTLRNKVYKLANESKNRAHCRVSQSVGNSIKSKEQNKNLKSELEVPSFENVNNRQNVSSASESLRQLLKHTITQKVQSATKNSDKINNEKGPPFSQISDMDAVTEQMFGNLEYSQALAPVLSHVFSDIQHLALVKSKENINCTSQSLSALKDDIKLPLLPDLIRRLAEERMELERDIHKDTGVTDQDGLSEMHSGSPSNVILKVPSFKPAKSPPMSSEVDDPSLPVLSSSSSPPPGTSSHALSGNKGIAVSLKELIARSISQKVNCHLKDKALDEEPNIEYSFTASNVDSPSCNIPWTVEGASKDGKEGCLSNINNSSNSSDGSKSDKRTRPKRGRYRNYDRDNLARAVRAVQKGEMSVHRAGTFYGVPHSTLEYKVKERHLLRPRKRDVLNSSLVSDTTEPVSTSKSNHTFPMESVSVKNLKNNLNQIAIEASNGLSTDTEQPHRPSVGSYPSPLSLWQNMPFLSLDFSQLGSNNFFASQMMRKLQENARLHEESQKKRKSQDFGILESLIKSTLERSVSPESKSTLILSTDSALSDCKETDDASEK